jgi:hypothetical protein
MLGSSAKWIVSDQAWRKLVGPCCCAAVLLCCAVVCLAQGPSESRPLYSPSVGQSFYEVAHELAGAEQLDALEIEQGVILLVAASRLDGAADYMLQDLIRLAAGNPDRDYSELIEQVLAKYVDESADLEVVRQAVSYLLARLNSRDQREQLLEQMLGKLGRKSKALDSHLAVQLGLLKAEKGDHQAALRRFMEAYNNDNYNRLAFTKLTELAGDQIRPSTYLQHLRLALSANPYDLESALAFAQYAERLQLYDVAAEAYKYCADLFGYLRPDQPLPRAIYLPWAISSYNTERLQHLCLQIASQVRQTEGFDLVLEAIAGRAAAKIGDKQQADHILKTAEFKALYFAAMPRPLAEDGRPPVNYQELAWFYCFGVPDANEAVEWANKAYASEPNSAGAASILAYALVMNGQTDWANLLLENYQANQIAELTLSQIELAQGQRVLAIETLKSAIERDPSSLAAERAKQILAQQGSEYLPALDPKVVLAALRGDFKDALVPSFSRPEETISVQLKLRGDKFSYSAKLDGSVVITNHSTQPVVISDEGMLAGDIRIDAAVTGDLERNLANLISSRILPAGPIEPDASISVPVQLCTGRLRQILLAHPQAVLKIMFTVYLDPVIGEAGQPTNRLHGLEPATATVERSAVDLSSRYLQNRLDSFTKGQQGQKIKTAQLFAGLLKEQQVMAGREPPYKIAHADWMGELVGSVLSRNLSDEDWPVRVHTMVAMLDLPLDYDLANAVAESLHSPHWPVRLMSVFLLAKSQGDNFVKVLDWTAKYDPDIHVRQMAVALGGKRPPAQQPPQKAPAARGQTLR